MKTTAFATLGVLGLLAPPPAEAQAVQGFADLRFTASPGASGEVWQLIERVRPSFSAELAERVRVVATVEAALAQGRHLPSELARALEAAGQDWPSYTNEVFRIDRSADYLDVDRLHLDLYLGPADLRVGRQALNWGSAQFFNPTDPFPEVLLAEPWRPRRGVNAVRAHVPFGELHDASLVVATNDTLDALRAAGRVRFNWLGTDLALVGAYRGDSESGLVGIDLRGTLELGFWLEAAYHFGPRGFEELSAGLDYSLPVLERLTLLVQYYRNGSGSTAPSVLDALPLQLGGASPRDPFAPFVRGRDYLLIASTLLAEPELSLSVATLQNLNDGTGFVLTTVSYNLLDWLDVACTAQVPHQLWGDGGELRPGPEDLRLTVDVPTLGERVVDLRGLVPTASVTFWSRANF